MQPPPGLTEGQRLIQIVIHLEDRLCTATVPTVMVLSSNHIPRRQAEPLHTSTRGVQCSAQGLRRPTQSEHKNTSQLENQSPSSDNDIISVSEVCLILASRTLSYGSGRAEQSACHCGAVFAACALFLDERWDVRSQYIQCCICT